MPEPEQQSFQELFDSEPTHATGAEAATWVDFYERLVMMVERQLEETRAFADTVHEPMRRYLNRENVTILEEEISAFKERLAHWTSQDRSS